MGSTLPKMPREEMEAQIQGCSPEPLSDEVMAGLWAHYQELLRWNPKLSLIGPGTAAEVVTRHYGESLAALPLLDSADRVLVDLGSGGGFPGFVLAVARPSSEVVLVEPKERKWAFLETAARRARGAGAALSCQVLDARVESPLPASLVLPEKVDVITCRALALKPQVLESLVQRFAGVRFLLWSGQETENMLSRDLTGSLADYGIARRLHLDGSDRRFILELAPRAPR